MPSDVSLLLPFRHLDAVLSGWAQVPRWEVLIGGALLGALAIGGVFYALLRGDPPPKLIVPFLAVGVLLGGFAGFVVVADQDVAYSTPDRRCAFGPWTASWQASEDVYAKMPQQAANTSWQVHHHEAADRWPSAPANAPDTWRDAGLTGVRWEPSSEHLREWSNGSVSVSVERDDPGLRLLVRLEGQGYEDEARRVAVEALDRSTNASQEDIERWTTHLGGDERLEGELTQTAYPKNVTLDLYALVAELGHKGWNVTWGPPISPATDPAEIHLARDSWTVQTLVPVTRAEGEVNGTGVQLAVSSTNHLSVQVDSSEPLSDESWSALVASAFGELGVAFEPQRTWSPAPSSVC